MSTDLVVLCRTRPTLHQGNPAGLVWDSERSVGSYLGADLRLEESETLLPDGTRLVAAVTLSFSHRSVDEKRAFAVEALAEQIARESGGAMVDPQSGDDDPWLAAYRRAREERYLRERRLSEQARARVATRARPENLEELRAAFAPVLVAPGAPEPDDLAARDAMAMLHTWAGDSVEQARDFDTRFAPLALALARDGARVATARRLQDVLARYALGAALTTPAIRAELVAGGPLARTVADLWERHDVLRAKQRSWLRKAWPRIAAELLQLAPPPADPKQLAVRRAPKSWSDALLDELLRACEATRGPASLAPFIEHLGLSPGDAELVVQRIRSRLPSS